MQVTFIGDPRKNSADAKNLPEGMLSDPPICTIHGERFIIGEPKEVPAKVAKKLEGHSHFKVGRPKLKAVQVDVPDQTEAS